MTKGTMHDGTSRAGVAEHIRQLAPLGRSERWLAAVAYWADLVADEANPLDWALLQGSVNANREA